MSSRLYVGNLSYETDTETLRSAFAANGEVTDAHVVMDRESGRSRGFGFVTMATPELAKKAIETMNGSMRDGRPIRVNEAEERPRGGGGGGPLSPQTFHATTLAAPTPTLPATMRFHGSDGIDGRGTDGSENDRAFCHTFSE